MGAGACSGAAKEGEAAEAEATAEGGGPLVTEADIANIVAQWTGIPVEKVLACITRTVVVTQKRVGPDRGCFVPGAPEVGVSRTTMPVAAPLQPLACIGSTHACKDASRRGTRRAAGSTEVACAEGGGAMLCPPCRCPATRASG